MTKCTHCKKEIEGPSGGVVTKGGVAVTCDDFQCFLATLREARGHGTLSTLGELEKIRRGQDPRGN